MATTSTLTSLLVRSKVQIAQSQRKLQRQARRHRAHIDYHRFWLLDLALLDGFKIRQQGCHSSRLFFAQPNGGQGFFEALDNGRDEPRHDGQRHEIVKRFLLQGQ